MLLGHMMFKLQFLRGRSLGARCPETRALTLSSEGDPNSKSLGTSRPLSEGPQLTYAHRSTKYIVN